MVNLWTMPIVKVWFSNVWMVNSASRRFLTGTLKNMPIV